MRQSLRTQIERPLIFIFSTGLIFFLLFICSCGTVSESQNYCEQLADISRTATLLLCQALSRHDTACLNCPTNTLRYFERVVAGDTLSFLARISKSGGCIISWHSQHHPDGAVLIEQSPILVESDSSHN